MKFRTGARVPLNGYLSHLVGHCYNDKRLAAGKDSRRLTGADRLPD